MGIERRKYRLKSYKLLFFVITALSIILDDKYYHKLNAGFYFFVCPTAFVYFFMLPVSKTTTLTRLYINSIEVTAELFV